MALVIDDFARALFKSADKAAVISATEKMFVKELGFTAKEFRSIFKSETSLVKQGELWKFNGVSSEKVISKMRAGKLTELFEEMGIKEAKKISWITEKQNYLRENIMKQCPDLHYTLLEERLEGQFRNFKETVIRLNRDVNELKKINSELQNKVANSAGKAGWLKKTMFAKGVLVAGVAIGIVIEEVIKNIIIMKGCYFNQMSNGKVKKYKIVHRSHERSIPHGVESYEGTHEFTTKNLPWNLNIQIRQASVNHEKHRDLFEKFKNVKPTDKEIKECIKNNFDFLQQYFKDHLVTITDPFQLLFEDEKSRNCVACNHAAPIDSIDYVPLAALATNESLNCINHVSVYEAFKNFGENVIESVIEDFTDWTGLSGMWSKIGQFLLVVIIIVVVGQVLISKLTGSNPYERLIEEDIGIDMESSKLKM